MYNHKIGALVPRLDTNVQSVQLDNTSAKNFNSKRLFGNILSKYHMSVVLHIMHLESVVCLRNRFA